MQCFSLEKYLQKMRSHVLGDLSSSMAVEDPIETHVRESRDVVIGDVGVLHIFAPTLHLTNRVFVVAVFLPFLFLGGNRLIQKAIAHYYQSKYNNQASRIIKCY